jgi:hypothetical protein
MAQYLGSVTLVAGNNSFSTTKGGLKGLVIGNMSGYSVLVKLDGTGYSKNLYPGQVDFFPAANGYSGTLVLIATADLLNASAWPSSLVKVDAIGLNEPFNVAAYPMMLPQQAVSSSASGRNRYSASVSVGSTATKVQRLNIFNPKTSGMNYIFDSARTSTSDTGFPEIDLSLVIGSDLSFATSITVTAHNTGTAIPASNAHATFVDSAAGIGGTVNQLEIMDANNTGLPQDFLVFPDSVIVTPGNALLITLNGSVTAKAITETAKWTEVPI